MLLLYTKHSIEKIINEIPIPISHIKKTLLVTDNDNGSVGTKSLSIFRHEIDIDRQKFIIPVS